MICPCCNQHVRELTYDMEGAKCPKCGWLIYKKNERIDIMPKITLTDKEKVNLELYINFLTHNSDPCNGCSIPGMCCGCQYKNEYKKNLRKYDVADLLTYEEIKEYVDYSVKLVGCRMQVKSMINDIRNLEKKISEITESIDLANDSEKKADDTTEFYCESCKMHFTVPNDKCKIAFDGEGTLESNIRKYYICPKCTKICWGK